MGYTIWYEGTRETPLTEEEHTIVRLNQAGCLLSDDAEDFTWGVEEGGCKLLGWTKPSRDEDELTTDMDAIIEAVEQLDRRLSGFVFKVTDDFGSELYPA